MGKESIEETELQVWDEVYAKNAKAAIIFTKMHTNDRKKKWEELLLLLTYFRKRGGGRPWFNIKICRSFPDENASDD